MRYLSPGNRVTAGNRVTPGNRLSRARGGARRVMTNRDETDGCHLPKGNLPFNPLGQDATCLAKMPTLAPDKPLGAAWGGFHFARIKGDRGDCRRGRVRLARRRLRLEFLEQPGRGRRGRL